uniref:Putative isopenicillin-n-synthase n=1 Tax=Beroe forskalii TaxID=140453 RepID=A0A0A0RZM6_BERFR|nr:putative isopenicillin-n-synthase [Beroe forskalii]
MSGKVLGAMFAIVAVLLNRDHLHTLFYKPHPLASVAVISYPDLLSNTTSSSSTDALIFSSMSQFGFFYVTNVTDFSAEEELEYLKMFFALGDEVKMRLAVRKHDPRNSNVYRGYGPVVEGTGTQYKEMFNIGPHEYDVMGEESPNEYDKYDNSTESEGDLARLKRISKEGNVWPETGDETFDRKFKALFKKGLQTRQRIARETIRSIGRSLGHPELIDRFTESEFSTLGLRRYPVRKTVQEAMNSAVDNVTLSELEHEDSTVTILTTFNYTGLQVLYDGKYWDAPPSGNGFIINIGTLIEDIADGSILAVRHRVKQMDFIRHSIPYFHNPSFDADISKSISDRQTKAGSENYSIFGEWMRQYLPLVEPGILQDKIVD